MLRERLQGHIVCVAAAAPVDGHGGLVLIVPKGQRRVVDLDLAPAGRQVLEAECDVVLTKQLAVKIGGRAGQRREAEQQGPTRGNTAPEKTARGRTARG